MAVSSTDLYLFEGTVELSSTLFGEPVAAQGLFGASGDELEDDENDGGSWRYQLHHALSFFFFLPRLIVQAVAMAAQVARGASPSTSAVLSLGWTASTKVFAFAPRIWALLTKKQVDALLSAPDKTAPQVELSVVERETVNVEVLRRRESTEDPLAAATLDSSASPRKIDQASQASSKRAPMSTPRRLPTDGRNLTSMILPGEPLTPRTLTDRLMSVHSNERGSATGLSRPSARM